MTQRAHKESLRSWAKDNGVDVELVPIPTCRDALPAGKLLTPLDTSQQPRKNDTGRGEERNQLKEITLGILGGQEHDLERPMLLSEGLLRPGSPDD